MLRVTIDLIPYGQEAYAENLRTIEIGNVGPYSPDDVPDGLYAYTWTCGDLKGEVKHFRKDPVETLVNLVLTDVHRTRWAQA